MGRGEDGRFSPLGFGNLAARGRSQLCPAYSDITKSNCSFFDSAAVQSE
jgi:hypothetical protein